MQVVKVLFAQVLGYLSFLATQYNGISYLLKKMQQKKVKKCNSRVCPSQKHSPRHTLINFERLLYSSVGRNSSETVTQSQVFKLLTKTLFLEKLKDGIYFRKEFKMVYIIQTPSFFIPYYMSCSKNLNPPVPMMQPLVTYCTAFHMPPFL